MMLNKTIRKLILLAILSGFVSITKASIYYFSSTVGDDVRTILQAQNPATPWKSLTKLNAIFSQCKAGDSILFKRGDIFYGSVTTVISGSSIAPIVLSAYGLGARPVISGFSNVSKWTSLGNGIYESESLPTSTTLNMVAINNLPYAMGRYPNASSANGGYLIMESCVANSVSNGSLSGTEDWSGGQLVVRTGRYSIEKSEIVTRSGNTLTYSSSFKYAPTVGYGFFIQNHLKTLDQFGEWYYNPSTKKLAVYFGQVSPASCQVEAAGINTLVNIPASNIVLDELALQGGNTSGIFNDWSGTTNLQVKNCSFSLMGMDAITLAGRAGFVMDNCLVEHANSNGVFLYTQNASPVVKNCVFKNIGLFAGMLSTPNFTGFSIYCSGGGLTATGNTVRNAGYTGIFFMGSSVFIQNNVIDSFCTTLDDGGGIYTYTGPSDTTYTNRKIIGNIVLNGIGAANGTPENYIPVQGIYLDDNSANVEVLNNTVAHCPYAGIFLHNTRDFIISGNVLYNNKYQMATQHDNLGSAITGGK